MAQSKDFMLNTLRGKIWLRVTALAFLNCVCGLLAYFAASFVISEPFILVFVIFLFSAFVTVVFGWWLSNEVLRPIEKVSLLAKSLERSPATSLPKTTGASETDELLETLHRNSRQLHNLIGLMDDVAAGKTDTALAPLENSDRISAAFQKLVARVTDSIDAKTELDSMRSAIDRLATDVSGVRSGNLNVSVRSDSPVTRELAETFRYLVAQLNELSLHVRVSSTEAAQSISDVRAMVRKSIEQDEANGRRIRQVSSTLRDAPNQAHQISNRLSNTIAAASRQIDNFSAAEESARENAVSITTLRKELTDSLHKVQKIRDQAKVFPKVSKSAEDLARRSNMIAINTSLLGSESNPNTVSISLLADEISTLSFRAEDINREISAINESTIRDIADVEALLQMCVSTIGGISTKTAEGFNAMTALDGFISQILEMPTTAADISAGQNAGNEEALRILGTFTSDGESVKANLNLCDEKIALLSHVVENLKDSISGIRPSMVETPAPPVLDLSIDLDEKQPRSHTFSETGQNGGIFDLRGDN